LLAQFPTRILLADTFDREQAGPPIEGGSSMKLRAVVVTAPVAALFAPAARAAAIIARADNLSQTMRLDHYGKVIRR
jgi:hypothetical protein